MKPTFAQMRILKRLAAERDAMLITETRERANPVDGPTFHARWYREGCQTCGHREKGEAVSWRAVFALEESGLIKALIPGGGTFTAKSITAAGYAALTSTIRTEP